MTLERRLLRDDEVVAFLAANPGWEATGERLRRSYRFPGFAEAIGWIAAVATYAESLDHHPAWRNVWRDVEVELWTHDLGSIGTLDVALAERMEQLAAPFGAKPPG